MSIAVESWHRGVLTQGVLSILTNPLCLAGSCSRFSIIGRAALSHPLRSQRPCLARGDRLATLGLRSCCSRNQVGRTKSCTDPKCKTMISTFGKLKQRLAQWGG